MTFPRRVVTGYDEQGRSVFVNDGLPPATTEMGEMVMSTLWHVDPGPLTPLSGGDPDSQQPDLEPPPGGFAWRVLRLPPTGAAAGEGSSELDDDDRFDKSRPGMHRTDTIDLVQIVDGRIELELDDDRVELGAGDCVVQRGTWHRWKVLGDEPCTFSAVMLRSAPDGDPSHEGPGPLSSASRDPVAPRRVVTHLDASGKSVFISDGPVANAVSFEHGAGMGFADIWQTLGPVHSPAAGGDQREYSCDLHPLGDGVSWKRVVIPPASALAGTDSAKFGEEMARRAPGMGHGGEMDPDEPGRHRTQTIDFIQILEGEITLSLDDGASVDLAPGDCVIQRGTWHTWTNRSNAPCVYQAILVATDALPG
jgi:uncharacterized cupin superfamily protein